MKVTMKSNNKLLDGLKRVASDYNVINIYEYHEVVSTIDANMRTQSLKPPNIIWFETYKRHGQRPDNEIEINS